MIIDIRYHIASLVAVFLALGMGILLGSAILGVNVNEAVVQQQNRMYDNLKRDLETMKKNNEEARAEIGVYEDLLKIDGEFEKMVLPKLVKNKLAGMQVAVIKAGDLAGSDEWFNTLRLAGAKISSVTDLLEQFDIDNQPLRQQMAVKLMLNSSSKEVVLQEVAKEIAEGVLSAQNIENLRYLEQLGMIKINGQYGTEVDAIVLVGGMEPGQEKRVLNLDIPMIDYFLARNISVYGVEHSKAGRSSMKQYQKQKISTVDNIDMASGQFSLIEALAGKPGNYGIKATAVGLLPGNP